jgi:hypothetical protein
MLLTQSKRHLEAWVTRPGLPLPDRINEERRRPMNIDNPEVVELGLAEELIQDEFSQDTTESVMPAKVKLPSATYVADAE